MLNSPGANIVVRAVADIKSQAELAEWTNADTVNFHGGGYGDKPAALGRFRRNLNLLSPRARTRLTVENDDITFTPADLLPLCRSEGVPLAYDAHATSRFSVFVFLVLRWMRLSYPVWPP